MDMKNNLDFPVCRIGDIKPQIGSTWLIESLWLARAAGLIGGQPKNWKSWLGLDMAISVASGTPCLGRFAVKETGTALIYLAEDKDHEIYTRADHICRSRGLNIKLLDVQVITAPVIRLDTERDQERLCTAVDKVKPRLLLLDPLVRLHRLDENNSRDISGLLGFLREIQRHLDTAVVLTHHSNKRSHARPGQSLRGSSDLHAFGDSNIYLTRDNDEVPLTVEHRSAPAMDTIRIILKTDDPVHLEVVDPASKIPQPIFTIEHRIVKYLANQTHHIARQALRDELKINNQRFGQALTKLIATGQIVATQFGIAIKHSELPGETESGSAGTQPYKG